MLDADDPRLVRDVVRAKADPREKEAYELVEEFMIAANEAVGSFFARRGVTVWRVHAPPKAERLEELAEALSAFGFKVDVEQAQSPLGLRELLGELVGHPAERALSFQVLRSMTQAVYATENVGHFGLASNRYLHFTSPIRRYPDLIVHRLLKHHLHRDGQASGTGELLPHPTVEELGDLARQASSYERRAVEAEREAVALYRAYLMRDQIGEELQGTVSGVTSFGVFVELDEPFVEGLIKVEALGDERFDFDARRMQISGRKSGLTLGLADRVTVEVIGASIIKRKVDLRLVEIIEHSVKRTASAPAKDKKKPKKRDDGKSKSGRGRGKKGKKADKGESAGKAKKRSRKRGRR